MTGLVLQDFLGIRKVLKTYAIVMIFYIVLGVVQGNVEVFGSFFLFFVAMLPMTAFAYRESSHWDMYAGTMPVSRKDMVNATYLVSGIFLAVGGVLVFLLNVLDIVRGSADVSDIFGPLGIIFCIAVIFVDVMIPVLFKFGTQRGRVIIMACYMVPLVGAIWLANLGLDEKLAEFDWTNMIKTIQIGVAVFTIVWTMISYVISVRIYQKKDIG